MQMIAFTFSLVMPEAACPPADPPCHTAIPSATGRHAHSYYFLESAMPTFTQMLLIFEAIIREF
jgi:hypothetical protein